MKISETSIRRPVFAVMLIGGLVALGLVSIPRLGIDLFPRVEFPLVSVQAVLPGQFRRLRLQAGRLSRHAL